MFSQRAILQTLLLFAVTHLMIISYTAFTTKDYEIFNVFRILNLDTYFPHLAEGRKNLLLSLVFVAGVYLYVLNSKMCMGC